MGYPSKLQIKHIGSYKRETERSKFGKEMM